MKTETIEIVDRGRGPQLSTTRITVAQIFYWMHRGFGWDKIHQSMPTLTRAEFDVVVDYIEQHRDELLEEDRRAEEYTERRMAEQHARGGIFAEPDPNLTIDQRVARLREILKRRIAEKNGEGHPG
ncbi:MAG: hypothetical protein HY289_00105 [Planctomycetes bacterium]|nr:hypothetical protein [Planctomycetota bacterium]